MDRRKAHNADRGNAPARRWVVPLAECSPSLAMDVGGKAKGLYSLCNLGLPVPAGVAITAEAYREAVSASGANTRIAEVLAQHDVTDEHKSRSIAGLFGDIELPTDLIAEIDTIFWETKK